MKAAVRHLHTQAGANAEPGAAEQTLLNGTKLEQCLQVAQTMGYTEVENYCDINASGMVLDREGLNRAREAIRKEEASLLIVPALHHLTRNPGDMHKLFDEAEEHEAKIISIEEGVYPNAISKFAGAMFAVAEKQQREMCIRRMRTGHEAKRRISAASTETPHRTLKTKKR
jgi:DNA invertase Pin-like site-specific DNA recombinase